jgi:alkylhydroperoxidase family enzyme
MSRLPLLEPAQTTGELRTALEKMPKTLNMFRMLAHAEHDALPVLRLANAILHRQLLGERPRELLILLAAQLEGGRYEWHQHSAIAQKIGIPQAAIDAVAAGRLDGSEFDDAERTLLAFGKAVVEDVRVEPALFARVQQYFGAREIVEAIVTIGFYMMVARITEATETDLDPAYGVDLYRSGKHRGT